MCPYIYSFRSVAARLNISWSVTLVFIVVALESFYRSQGKIILNNKSFRAFYRYKRAKKEI